METKDHGRSRSPLTPTQRRALRVIARMQDSGEEVAHDLCGDLSLTSGNWPATHYGLVRRGLIEAHYDPMAPAEEAWTYTLTPLGRGAVLDIEGAP